MSSHPSPLVLGIDTGGTYTDGVLLDYRTQEILATVKTLTTHHDLSLGILSTLDALLPEEPSAVKLISISTTLVTNAIAENKSRPVALFLFGYDEELVRRFSLAEQFGTPKFFYFRGGHDLYGKEQCQPDLAGMLQRAKTLDGSVEAFAVSAYFSPLNASHEEAAAQALAQVIDLPVVQGHQLSTRLDSVKRATTATLNAALLSISHEFVAAVQGALCQRGITCPLMVVRGDGALMNVKSANQRPVETIHSGPAASAIGGRFLAGVDKGLVIDVGGTTTDIAIIDKGRVNILDEGTRVGNYHTAVRAANVRSFGLGGDSMLSFDSTKRLQVGPARVVPISYLASQHAVVAAEIRQIAAEGFDRPFPRRVEYWFLKREPRRPLQDDCARAAVDLLRQRPYSLPGLLKALDLRSTHQMDGERLIEEDIVGRAALTPTDLLHVSGEYAPWDGDAARISARTVALVKRWTPEKLLQQVKEVIAEKIVAEIIAFISAHTLQREDGLLNQDNLGLWLFDENLHDINPYLGCQIGLKMPIIGMGAPAHIFLPRVAELLHTQLILPPNYHVANAVGAVAGNVIVYGEANLLPLQDQIRYAVQDEQERKEFSNLDEALFYAKELLAKKVIQEAQEMGALQPHLEFKQTPTGAESYRLTAQAIGNPRLGE